MLNGRARPVLSVVVPLFDEARGLGDLHDRLGRTLEALGRPYEIIFVDDGSRDGSADTLRTLHARDGAVKVIRLDRNYGQHVAVFAGMEHAKGDVIVTLDADLQNPPEEIPRLLAALTDSVDVVGGARVSRRDPWARRVASRIVNRVTSAAVGVRMRDCGCMLRAYRRSVIDQILSFPGVPRHIPVLAASVASAVSEIPVAHRARAHGRSRYGVVRLLRLTVDLVLQILALRRLGKPGDRIRQDAARPLRYAVREVLE